MYLSKAKELDEATAFQRNCSMQKDTLTRNDAEPDAADRYKLMFPMFSKRTK